MGFISCRKGLLAGNEGVETENWTKEMTFGHSHILQHSNGGNTNLHFLRAPFEDRTALMMDSLNKPPQSWKEFNDQPTMTKDAPPLSHINFNLFSLIPIQHTHGS